MEKKFVAGFDNIFSSAIPKGKVLQDEEETESLHEPEKSDQNSDNDVDNKIENLPQIDIEKIKKDAFDEGYKKAKSEDKTESEQINKQINESFTKIEQKLEEIIKAKNFDDLKKSDDLIELCMVISKKIAGDALQDNAILNIEQIIIQSFNILFEEPEIKIEINPDIEASIKKKIKEIKKSENYEGKLKVISSDKVNSTACNILWKGGGLKFDPVQLTEEIENIIDKFKE